MKKVFKIVLIFIIFIGVLAIYNEVQAAASASIRASKTKIKTGESVTITASVSKAESYQLSITSNGGTLSGNLSNADAFGSAKSQQVLSGTFKASKAGTYRISLSGDVSEDLVELVTVSKSVTITVTAPETNKPSNNTSGGSSSGGSSNNTPSTPAKKSSNANLTAIKVAEGELTPKFSKSVKSYTLNVAKDIEKVDITATKENSKATYKVTRK